MAAGTAILDAHSQVSSNNNNISLTTTTTTTAAISSIISRNQSLSSSTMQRIPAVLTLENGAQFKGYSWAHHASVSGEVVFQTGMVGYPESITDPSYRKQILVFTYPLIGNYGAPDDTAVDHIDNDLPLKSAVESNAIHVQAVVVAEECAEKYQHFAAARSLNDWLKASNITAIAGIDTRALTRMIRNAGTMLGKIDVGPDYQTALIHDPGVLPVMDSWVDPNKLHLVAEVSTKSPKTYGANATGPHILIVDCGIKLNQIRCFLKRSCKVTVVPWDYDFNDGDIKFDALFISNGPGDPTMCDKTVQHIQTAYKIAEENQLKANVAAIFPIFGICLGHQLMSLAAGFKTYKLKYGNRGHNQPCIDLSTEKCYITSQNHGYAVDTSFGNIPPNWSPSFVNANDDTNEGISHKFLPFFSVQFHPEARAGPHDTEYLFDLFLQKVTDAMYGKPLSPAFVIPDPRDRAAFKQSLSKEVKVTKVLILGSGGLSIGQAGEFDYSGSQCIKALKEEGIQTILINPNIATVQTARGLADKVYFVPVDPENVINVIKNEHPDGILLTFGGQTALNCGVQLYKRNVFEELNVKVLGTPIEAILDTEDRERFNARLEQIKQPYATSCACSTVQECIDAANSIGYPLIVRAAFALGGLGSGFADNEEELVPLVTKAFSSSDQVLVERSMKGWKEVEYEVVRDAYDNCITVCNMENFDPLGVHTGDSIVIAPSQTLDDYDYNMLRDCAIKTVRHLGVVGECNIQYALNPANREFCVIEVNARLSRSSALASKATGYPLAFVAAKLALGKRLSDIRNSVTKVTTACFEPSLDYLVVKIPRWDLKKFTRVSRNLGSAMKSVGEVMAIGRNFEETIQKAIRMVRDNYVSGFESGHIPYIEDEVKNPTDDRLLIIATALAEGKSVDYIHDLSKIDKWFLRKLENISKFEQELRLAGSQEAMRVSDLSEKDMRRAKALGFSDKQIAKLLGDTEMSVRSLRLKYNIVPFVKQIDTVAAEFPAQTNYLYTTYSACEFTENLSGVNVRTAVGSDDGYPAHSLSDFTSFQEKDSVTQETEKINEKKTNDIDFNQRGVIVLGSGAYRIGSSVEFDNCAVSAIRTLRSNRIYSIMINYNPETVSTDYDECDRLYFDELSLERVLDIYEMEASLGVIVSMGGQLPNNIAMQLHRQSCRILGTTPEMIDAAENRYKFSRMCDRIGVDQPKWKELTSIEDAKAFCSSVGYPCLVRPSYILSGAAMNVAHKEEDLQLYLTEASTVSPDFPVVISKFILEAKEIEVDAVALRGELVMHVVSEHIENAGVHSGDATLVLPPQDLDDITVMKVEEAARKIAMALNVTGPMNIQFMAKNNEIKVIECNLRAARSFPFVSKTIGLDLAKMATKVMVGKKVKPYPIDIKSINHVGVKVAQFSFTRLLGADPILGVEMASTGEVACFGQCREEAYLKAFRGTQQKIPTRNACVSIGSYKEKLEFLDRAKRLVQLGFQLFATPGTADFFAEHGVHATTVVWPNEHEYGGESEQSLAKKLRNREIDLFINVPSNNKYRLATFKSPGYICRRAAVDFSVPIITNIKVAKLLVDAIEWKAFNTAKIQPASYDVIFSNIVIKFPGLICLETLNEISPTMDWKKGCSTALAGGFTYISGVSGQVAKDGSYMESFNKKLLEMRSHALCDYGLFISGDSKNTGIARSLASKTAGLWIEPGEKLKTGKEDITSWLSHFEHWPRSLPIVVKATGQTLASFLFGAIVHSRDIHVSKVLSREDLALIKQARTNGRCRVTCDVNILDLLTRPSPSDERVAIQNKEALWESLDVIDAVSGPPEIVLPLLLQAEREGRLSLEWIQSRLYDNPKKILNIVDSPDSFVEVEVTNTWQVPANSVGAGSVCRGKVVRVVVRGEILFLDGKVLALPGQGLEVPKYLADDLSVMDGETPSPSYKVERGHVPPFVLDDDQKRLDPSDSSPRLGAATSLTGAGGSQLFKSKLLLNRVDSQTGLDVMDKSAENQEFPAAAVATQTPVLPGALKQLVGYGSGWWAGRHILSVKQFTRNECHALFNVATEMRQMVNRVGHYDLLKGKILGNLFFEPSTRTQCSFQAAMQRLGGTVLSFNDVNMTSMVKGETMLDTVKTMETYADIFAIRHPQSGIIQGLAPHMRKPVVNAGDGIGEHPTQALLDVFTIREELGTVNGLTVSFVGDLKNGRTVHSLARVLSLYNVKLRYVSPNSLKLPSEILAEIASRGVEQSEHLLLEEVIRETDVLYMTRVQKERFASAEEYDKVKDHFIITPKTLTRAKENMIVMHPLPRCGEITPDVDLDPRAVYFRQMEHGLYVRMALLAMILGKA